MLLCRAFCRRQSYAGLARYSTASSFVLNPKKPGLFDESQPIRFRYGDGQFEQTLAQKKGVFWVDKTGYIRGLEAVQNETSPAVRLFRPRRFGKTLFVDTLAHYYDKNLKGRFDELFGHLDIGNDPTPLASAFHILRFDFSNLNTRTPEAFERDLNHKINTAAARFQRHYPEITFKIEDNSGIATSRNLMEAVLYKNSKVYVLIDEYDTSLNSALHTTKFVQGERFPPEHEILSASELIRQTNEPFKLFFSAVKEYSQRGDVRVFITGTTPLVLTEFTSGFNIALDLSVTKPFAGLFGFTKGDVGFALDALGSRHPAIKHNREALLAHFELQHNGYRFHHQQFEGLFNPTRMLDAFRKLVETAADLPPHAPTVGLVAGLTADPNSMPAEAALQLVSQMPTADGLIKQLLVAQRATVGTAGGLKENFSLSDLGLADDTRALMSFMFYQGALTFASPADLPPFNPSLPELRMFGIPNHVAREEFVQALLGKLKIKLSVDERRRLRDALDRLANTGDADPLRRAVETMLLRSAGRDMERGEDAFHMFLYGLLLVTHPATHRIAKELRIAPRWDGALPTFLDVAYFRGVSLDATGYVSADGSVVEPTPIPEKIAPGAEEAQTVAISLKTLRIRDLDLGQQIQGWVASSRLSQDEQQAWETFDRNLRQGGHQARQAALPFDLQQKIGRLVSQLSDAEVGDLLLRTPMRTGNTVSALARYVELEYLAKYGDALEKDKRFGKVHAFAWIQVAVFRVFQKTISFS